MLEFKWLNIAYKDIIVVYLLMDKLAVEKHLH